MNIRAKLTLTFFAMVIVVLTLTSVSIYYFYSDYRKLDFNRRLKNRAINTAKVLVEVKEVNAELLKRMEKNNPASLSNQYIAIYNNRDEEVYNSGGTNEIDFDPGLLKTIRLKQEITYTIPGYEVLGFIFSDGENHYTVVAAATDVYGLKALDNLRDILIGTFSVSVVFVSLLGWFYAGKVLSPISQIVNEVDTITELNLNRRLDDGNKKDELGKLARTFNQMLRRLQGAFSLQRNFIANASHEIKTPITAMSAEIEVSLLQDREKSYYVNVLRSVLNGLRGLNRMSSQLLLLAQTSSEKQERHFRPMRIDDLIWDVKTELQKAHKGYVVDIQFNLDLNHESMVIDGDTELVRVCLLNLMDNGCKYSNDNKVNVNLYLSDKDQITIEFINFGRGIEPESLGKIFEPFFRSKGYRNIKGFGIGLSLVRSIVTLHQGVIKVESTPNEQTRFQVSFPILKQQPGLIPI